MKNNFDSPLSNNASKINVVGGSSEQRTKLESQILKNYSGEDSEFLDDVRAHEYEKSDLENEMIDACNEVINEYLAHLGLEGHNFPKNNIHIVDSRFYKTKIRSTSAGVFSPLNMRILLNHDLSARSPYLELEDMLHEMTHAKGHVAFKINNKQEHYVSRIGLSIKIKDEASKSFEDNLVLLNEMIVSEFEKKLYSKVIDRIDFFKQNDSSDEGDLHEAEDILQDISERGGVPKEEILFYRHKEGGPSVFTFSYSKSRKLLATLIDGIYLDNAGVFGSRDEVYDLFFKSHFTGDMGEIFNMMKKSFGGDIYEILKTLRYDEEEIGKTIITLIERRQNRDR